MWFTGIAKSRGCLAHYNILQEKKDIYQAILIKYDGKPDRMPPANFILVRGAEKWSGNIEDQGLLDQLGKVIDVRERGRLYDELHKSLNIENRKIS